MDVLFLLVLALVAETTKTGAPKATALGFKCSSSTTTCQSLVGYKTSENTTLSAIAKKFGLPSYASLLGPNALPLHVSPRHRVGPTTTVRVPVPCRCTNGTGYSDGTPVHTVADGEYLDLIASTVFSGLVDWPSIAAVNRLPDPNKIDNGQRLQIPLPCSCDPIPQDFPVMHYAHLVASGSDLDGIAAQFGTNVTKLMDLNDIKDPTLLLAGQVLDVPLRVCSSVFNTASLDKSLPVANGSYALTANNCVLCQCSNTWQLDCKPNPLANMSKCPSMKCQGTDLVIGNSTVNGCSSCSYAGYVKDSILTNMTTDSVCKVPLVPALPPTGANKGSPPNFGLTGVVPSPHKLICCFILSFLSSILLWKHQ